MRKGLLAVWAIVTFVLAWGAFALTMPVYNRAKVSEDAARAFRFLVLPFVVQIIWFAGGAVYSLRTRRREPVIGILLGFGLELLVLLGLILFSASSHY